MDITYHSSPKLLNSKEFNNQLIKSIFNETISSAKFINLNINNSEIIQLFYCLTCNLLYSKSLKQIIIKNTDKQLFKSSY